jgi:hypothetical protein
MQTELEKLIPQAKDLFEPKEILVLENLLQKILIDNTEKKTNLINGKIELVKTTAEIVKPSLRSFYNSKQYQNSISKYLINIKNISDAKYDLYKKNGLQIEKSALSPSQNLVIKEHIEYLNESGLNANFNNKLRTLIYTTITKGASLTDLKENLNKYIAQGKDKNGYFSKYIDEIAIKGADAYNSIIDQKIVEKYNDKITGYLVTGSLIETSSLQCRYCIEKLDRKITKNDFKTILDKYSNNMIEGTTFDNLPTNKLHYNCRHSFTPTLK